MLFWSNKKCVDSTALTLNNKQKLMSVAIGSCSSILWKLRPMLRNS